MKSGHSGHGRPEIGHGPEDPRRSGQGQEKRFEKGFVSVSVRPRD